MIYYWLLKRVISSGGWRGVGFQSDTIGIISFADNDLPIFVKIDAILGMAAVEWYWVKISQAEYETYQAFGFEEYKV